MEFDFEEIRCYKNEEVHDVLERLSSEKQFMKVLSTVYPLLPKEFIKQRLMGFQSSYAFQKEMVYPFLQYLEANMTLGIKLNGLEKIDISKSYLYISNHRDIILDSAFLCGKFIERNMDTVQIAIGDNLLIYPWIKDLVRVNKSFIVKRGLSARQILESSKCLSAYIAHVIDGNQSIWLAQREGRAKDSNDRTQESLLKMLNMFGTGSFIENLTKLNICPLSISYEYDPCDFLKAKEMQQRRDDVGFKKNPQDDLLNMKTGVMGYKGKVVYEITGDISNELKIIATETSNRNEQITLVAELIDKRIHANYTIFANNKIAYDILKNSRLFSSEYTQKEETDFEKYLSLQIGKIDLENKDESFLRARLLEMYANPLINKLNTSSNYLEEGE
ncbi:MAG: 1-acyl-sn-glycerol-3-phosphate acyltransferase [Bacteroidota bacterium]|nr:1-acyl-sn-glycerol-3-phosphate acyltransferase [Bacteroidota bacterium]